eukprot:s1101_g15.t2
MERMPRRLRQAWRRESASKFGALLGRGLPAERILSPNVVPAVVEALSDRGISSWCGRVQDFLRSSEVSGALDLLFLDYTGCLASRASHFRPALRALRPHGVLACTFSMRHSPVEDDFSYGFLPPQPEGWSHAHALHALGRCLLEAAEALGLRLEGAGLPGLNDYELFDNMSAAAWAARSAIDASETTCQRVIRALEEENIPALAEALASWAEEPNSELPWLRKGVATVAGRVRHACRGGVLGCAWRSGDEGRGSPHCLLGANGAVQDKDLNKLRKAAVALKQAGSSRGSVCAPTAPTRCPAFSFRRSMLVYPEEMMFFMVRCAAKKQHRPTASPSRESIYGVRVWLGLFFGHLQVSKYFITAHSNRRFRRFRESLRISKSQADCTKVASRCSEFISCIQTFVCAKAQSARGHFQRLCLPFPDPSLPLGHPLRTPVPSIPTVPALSGRDLCMAKASVLWLFGYRKCESCQEYSNSGWFDADDVWYCEECQMNCVLDLFSDEPVPAESWLRCGIRRVRELPALASSQLLVCTCELVKVGGHAGLFGGRLVLTGTGMALGSLWSHLQGGSGPRSLGTEPTKVDAASAAAAEAAFADPWVVVVDSRPGCFIPGDPVEVSDSSGKGWRGVVKCKAGEGSYIVEDQSQTPHNVAADRLRVDELVASVL